jgi:hypothetical protein
MQLGKEAALEWGYPPEGRPGQNIKARPSRLLRSDEICPQATDTSSQSRIRALHRWLMPVILATQELSGGSQLGSQFKQIIRKILSQK